MAEVCVLDRFTCAGFYFLERTGYSHLCAWPLGYPRLGAQKRILTKFTLGATAQRPGLAYRLQEQCLKCPRSGLAGVLVQTIPGPLHHSDLRARQAHATGGTRSSGKCPWSHSPRPAPHPVAPAGASGGSARPSWGPAPSAWTFSHPRGSFGRTSRRGKPGPRRRGRRRLRRTSHCIGSRRARVAPATSRPPPGRRAASASAEAPGRRGGTNGQGRGRKAVSTRSPRPAPLEPPARPSGTAHARNPDRLPTHAPGLAETSRGRAPGSESAL